MARNIPMVLNGEEMDLNAVGPIFYDGANKPHALAQCKKENNDKYALLLALTAGDVWVEVARDESIWGFPALVERTDGSGTAYLCGQTRDMQLRIGADVPNWVSTVVKKA